MSIKVVFKLHVGHCVLLIVPKILGTKTSSLIGFESIPRFSTFY